MSNWAGYLLKATATGAIFPDKYISYESYSSTPNHREEIKAYRDENSRDLTRITAAGRKSDITFTTREGLTLEEKMEIQSFFTTAESDPNQRKVALEFWNDEENTYKTGYFYRPNMPFQIKKITDETIFYKALTIDLVEY